MSKLPTICDQYMINHPRMLRRLAGNGPDRTRPCHAQAITEFGRTFKTPAAVAPAPEPTTGSSFNAARGAGQKRQLPLTGGQQ